MCSDVIDPGDLPYTVSRIWSNKAAAASHDPCVPAPEHAVYFNAAPDLPDETVTAFGIPTGQRSVNIAQGDTRTITIRLFSDGDSGGDWEITAQDIGTKRLGYKHPTMALDLSQSHGRNGDKIQLSITPLFTGYLGTADIFVLTATNAKQEEHFWYGIVGEQWE